MNELTLADVRKEETLKRNCIKFDVQYVSPDKSPHERDLMCKALERNRKRNKRSRKTSAKKVSRLNDSKIQMRRLRKQKTADIRGARLCSNKAEADARRHKNKIRMQQCRKEESQSEKIHRQSLDRNRKQHARANESPAEKRNRQHIDKLRTREARAMESPAKQQHRNKINATQMRHRRAVEKSKQLDKRQTLHTTNTGEDSCVYQPFDATNILLEESGFELGDIIVCRKKREPGCLPSPVLIRKKESKMKNYLHVYPRFKEEEEEGRLEYYFSRNHPQPTKDEIERSELLVECGVHDRGRSYQRVCAAHHILQKINFSGNKIRKLANKVTGTKEGMKMNRTIYYAWYGQKFIVPAPTPNDLKLRTIDIEDIDEIVDGCILLNQRPEKERFEIRGAAGQVFAVGSADDADYIVDADFLEDNVHAFNLLLTDENPCPKEKILACEIHINGYKAIEMAKCEVYQPRSALDEHDGIYYKRVSHSFICEEDESVWEWREYVSVDISFGPLPEKYVSDFKTKLDKYGGVDEPEPYQILFDSDSDDMTVEFSFLTFSENNMKKGGTLHSIACRELGKEGKNSEL